MTAREEEKVRVVVMIRSDPNYVGEIEPNIRRERVCYSPTDVEKKCSQIPQHC